MTNLSGALNQAVTGLRASQYALSVISQNIANADTPGYTRETTDLEEVSGTSTGLYTGHGSLAGVRIATTNREDDPVLDARLRSVQTDGAMADTASTQLQSVETLFPEPSSSGLGSQLSTVWNDWANVANNPGGSSSTAVRQTLLSDTATVAGTLNTMSTNLAQIQTTTSAQLTANVTAVNTYAGELATLNGQIGIATATGANANSLMDQRDQLLTHLSSLTGAVATINANGSATVALNGQTLVSSTTSNAMTVNSSNQLSVGGTAVTLSTGAMAAQVTALTTTFPGFQSQLDSVANALASTLNAAQASGFDQNGNAGTAMIGTSDGSGTVTAANIKVILTSPSRHRRGHHPDDRRQPRRLECAHPLECRIVRDQSRRDVRQPGRLGRYHQRGRAAGAVDAGRGSDRGDEPTAIDLWRELRPGGDRHDDLPAVLQRFGEGAHHDRRPARHAAQPGRQLMTAMTSLFRVTAANSNTTTIANIAAASNRLAALQNEMSSGAAISRPSDNPDGTVQAMQLQGQLARNTQYGTNANDGLAWLSTADSAYSQSVTVLQQARTLVVQALNTGAGDASSATAIADQINGLRNTLLSIANTSYNGRPVFGGTTASGSAYDANGNYVGDSGSVTRQISSQSTVSVSAVGTSVFGSAGSDAFTLLANIASTLQTNPTSLNSSTLSQIDAAISTVSGAQSQEAASYKQVQAAQTTQTTTGTALQTQLSGIEQADMASVAIALSSANLSYQAALQTTASIRQMSLLNFLQ